MSVSGKDDQDRTTDVTGVVPVFVSDEPTARHVSALQLVCVAGEDLGRTFRIERLPVVIGRGHVDVALYGLDVSRNHARLSALDNTFAIEDLGSQNGTYVNGVMVQAKATVHVGDRIQIGSTIFVLARHDELEERMHQLQRLEALAGLAGGLAHDFNNALAVILATIGLFEHRLPPGGDLHAMLADMKIAAESASALARRLLRLGRSEPLPFEAVSVASLCQRTAGMLRRQLPGIEVHIDVSDALVVRGSHDELLQVLTNLFINARDAMPRGGTLRVVAHEVTFDRAGAAAMHLPSQGDYVELIVADTGTGMDDATLARAFDPFFTTKPPGQGTGLGLAMCHSIVRRHGGAIVAESALGSGTTIRIWLPRAV